MEAKEVFMQRAITLAKQSAKEEDYALGAVIVKNGKVIATGKTRLKHQNDPTLHAEIVAIRNACKKLGSRFLEDCVLYTTHEPCPMCSAAAVWAKMEGVVFGAFIEDAKQKGSSRFSWRQINLHCEDVLKKGTPRLNLVKGFLREECVALFDLSL